MNNAKTKRIIAFWSSTFICVIAGLLIKLMPPKEYVLDFIYNKSSIYGNRHVLITYIVCCILFPTTVLLIFKIIEKYNLFSLKNTYIIIVISYIEFLLFIVFYVYVNLNVNFMTLEKNYFISKFYDKKVLFIGIIVFALVSCIAYFETKITKGIFKITKDVTIFLIGTVAIYKVSELYISRIFLVYDLHIDAYFYPVYKTVSGQIPYVDFKGIYGGYEYFVAPFITGIGEKAIFQFTQIMALLVCICFTALLISLFIICKNKIIAVFSVVAAMYYSTIFFIAQQGNSYYYQYMPHRMIFPCLFICLIVIYTKCRLSDRWKDFVRNIFTFVYIIIGSMSILWNLDVGIFCVLIWPIFRVYLEYLVTGKWSWRYVFAQAVHIAALFSTFMFSVELITYVKTGYMFDVRDLLFGQSAFSASILNAEISIIHPWICLGILYAIALIKSIQIFGLRKDANIPKSELSMAAYYFGISISGIAIMSYAILKSAHPYNTTPVIYVTIILLAVFFQGYCNDISKGENRILSFLKIVTILGVFSVLTSGIICGYQGIKEKVNAGVEVYFPDTLGAIQKEVEGGEEIDLFMINSSYIYCLLEKPDLLKTPAVVDWFRDEELDKVLEYLSTSKNKFAIDKIARSYFAYEYSDLYDEIINKNFELKYIYGDDNIYIYERKKK